MPQDDKARRLVDQLHAVMEGAESAVERDAALDDSLSSQEIRVLRTVGRHERCIMSALAARIRLSLSGVTSLVDRLVEKRLVCRDRSREDRRVVQVDLTDEGRKLHASVMESQVRFARGVLKSLDAQEQETLLSLLEKISEQIKTEKNTG